MMEAFNLGNVQEIDFDHFVHLWRYVMDWQRCFRQFDLDKSGSINGQELMAAMHSFGFNLPPKLTSLMVQRFDRAGKQAVLFDDFIRCCLILLELTRGFQAKDSQFSGKVDMTYEDFIELVLSCGPLFA